jgi:hypothetical protein
MAKISSHDARTVAQVRATKPGNPDTWVTLTVTSDGRVLRKITSAHRSQWGTHYSNSNNKIVARVKTDVSEVTEDRLLQIAARWGYTERKDK